MSRKLIKITDALGEAYAFYCPGCDMMHIVPIAYPKELATRNGKIKPTWKFSGNFEAPSFVPNFKVIWKGPDTSPKQTCHCIIRNGELTYLVDTTHRLSGTRIKMVDQ